MSIHEKFVVLCITDAVKRRFVDTSDLQINTRLGAVLATSGDRDQGRKMRVKSSDLCNSADNIAAVDALPESEGDSELINLDS